MKQHALSTASTNLPCESHPRIFKSKPVGDICLDVAKFAGDRDCRTLEYLMKVAAAEAYECLDAPIDTSFQVKSFGMWDWDVSSNLAYVDPTTAGLFGILSWARKGWILVNSSETFTRTMSRDFARRSAPLPCMEAISKPDIGLLPTTMSGGSMQKGRASCRRGLRHDFQERWWMFRI